MKIEPINTRLTCLGVRRLGLVEPMQQGIYFRSE